MRTLLEKTMDLAFGAAALTREKVQEYVDELVKRGEAAKDESSSLVDDLIRRGQQRRVELEAFVQREVSEALAHMSIASRDDVARLERRIQELETVVEDLRAGARASRRRAAPGASEKSAAPGHEVTEVTRE